MEEGASRDYDPERIGTAAAAVVLWAAFACVRGKRRGGASASVRE